MHIRRQWVLLAVFIVATTQFFGCGFKDSTNLGEDFITDISPDLTNMNKHFKSYAGDTTSLVSQFSLPAPGDTGFGIHLAISSQTTSGRIVLGDSAQTSSVGVVKFVISPDNPNSRIYAANDSLVSVKLQFTRIVTNKSAKIGIYTSRSWGQYYTSHLGSNDTTARTASPFDTLSFNNDTTSSIDTVALFPSTDSSLAYMVFAACTTATTDTAITKRPQTFGVILRNLDPTNLVSIYNAAQLIVKYHHGKDTATHVYSNSNPASNTTPFHYYVGTDGSSASLASQPAMGYAAKRTACFKYDLSALWDTCNAGNTNSARIQLNSAIFSVKGKKLGDTLNISYLFYVNNSPDSIVHNGIELDSLFATSYADRIILADTATVAVNVLPSLRRYEAGKADSQSVAHRPKNCYLYFRYSEDVNQQWKNMVWTQKPKLTVMISIP